MGWQRWGILPPFTQKDVINLGQIEKTKAVAGGTPQQTLQIVGDVPFGKVAFDIGVTDGWIDVKDKKIHFTGGGLKTDAGKRDPSPTKGMDMETERAEFLDEVSEMPVDDVIRARVPKMRKKPRRKIRRREGISDITGFTGIRFGGIGYNG